MSEPKEKQKDYFKDSLRPVGESQVWLCGMALTVGILMVVGMLGLIFWQGIKVFWPKDIMQVVLTEDAPAEYRINGSSEFAGALVKKATKVDHSLSVKEESGEDWQFFVANKDAYGFTYKYIDSAFIKSTKAPENIVVAERYAWGHAIFFPEEIIYPDGDTISMDTNPEAFMKRFSEDVHTSAHRWKEIRKIEVQEIGPINAKINHINKRIEKATEAGHTKTVAELQANLASIQEDYKVLEKKARELRDKQTEIKLRVALATGEERTYEMGQVIDFFQPNSMGVLAKLQHLFTHLWHFLTENPRESNTEGGIFPAIFGTFVMTVMMSAAVMPFGVLAAIYLREYARQGAFLRAVRIAINNLAGVPSIVFGVFGLGFFVYGMGSWIDDTFFGEELVFGKGGILWASLTLALLTVPVVIVATEEALASVTRGMREASLACGASKWQTIQRVVLPAAAPGILTGLILAMARGAGEVAPLMLVGVVKNAVDLPFDTVAPFIHFERQFMHLGFHIYDLGFQSPDSEAARPMVFATTFLLILLVLVLNLGAIFIRNYLRRKYASGAF